MFPMKLVRRFIVKQMEHYDRYSFANKMEWTLDENSKI